MTFRIENLKYSQSWIWHPPPQWLEATTSLHGCQCRHSPPRGVSATRRCFVLRNSAVEAIRPSDFRWPWNGRRKHPQTTNKKGGKCRNTIDMLEGGKFRGKLMERSQVKQDSLSLIEFKLQKRRLEVQLAVRGNVTCILNHISIPTYMLQGSKGQVTVNGSNQIQTSCGNLDHAHLGFDNTTNNQQQTTNHEPQSTTLGWTSPNSIWACNLRPLSTISRLDSLKSTLLLGTSSEASWRFLAFWQTKGFYSQRRFSTLPPRIMVFRGKWVYLQYSVPFI